MDTDSSIDKKEIITEIYNKIPLTENEELTLIKNIIYLKTMIENHWEDSTILENIEILHKYLK